MGGGINQLHGKNPVKLSQLTQILSLPPLPSALQALEFHGVSIDTRTLEPGNLFIAIKGAQFDGHDYIAAAAKKGAVAVIADHPCTTSLPCIVVDNSVHAMGILAAHQRAQFQGPVIGLTGSCGKTTTRALVESILRHCGQTLSSERSFNNDIGVPLTLLRLSEKDRYAVLEMGANHVGEIAYLTNIVKPTVALITNATESHLEGFGSLAHIRLAKGEIFRGLAIDGTAVLNADDPYCTEWEKMLAPRRILRFSMSDALSFPVDIYTKNIGLQAPGYPRFTLVTPLGETPIRLPLLGRHNIGNALAAAACAYAVGAPLSAIQAGLESVTAVNKRVNLHTLAPDVQLIDDTYNANPLSMAAAIAILAQQPHEKVLVFGDMRELGKYTEAAHREVGKQARASGIDHLYTYGQESALAGQAFGAQAQHFTDQAALIVALKAHVLHPATLLIKGSRSMQMERVVAALLGTP
jgi:UDP-N-acetylmuramoyl-tripeptide--D-alanyl-D-alanine ligase